MDSRLATYEHIKHVQKSLGYCIRTLVRRMERHDVSKLVPPEVEYFDQYTPLLSQHKYGSDEYKATMILMKPAIEHHNASNEHHPEFHSDGIRGMTLIDLMEMICDWQAATLRSPGGDIEKSLEINQMRFGYSDDLKRILQNTAEVIIMNARGPG